MLITEAKSTYFVFPSWAHPGYSWEDLPRLFSNPLDSDAGRRRNDWKELGYPIRVQPYELIDGPAGGGIIRAFIGEREKWLPKMILNNPAGQSSLRPPKGMANFRNPGVSYIEPIDTSYGIPGLEKPIIYECSTTIEHVEGLKDTRYWICGYKKAKGGIKGMDELPGLARAFGINAVFAPEFPYEAVQKTKDWFVDPSYDYVWLTVAGGKPTVGYQFSALIYFGLHLRMIAGKRFTYMHLLCENDGKYNARPHWSRK